MSKSTQTYWPESLPKTLTYRLGEKPLHAYIKDHAMNTPTKQTYSFYGKELTWEALDEAIDRFAAFLNANGIQKGDCIGLFLQNCPQYIIAHYGIQRLGGIVAPLNPMYKESELDYLLNEAQVKVVVCGQELYSRVESIRAKTPSLEFVITTNYADYLPEKPPLPLPDELKLEKVIHSETFDFVSALLNSEPLPFSVEIDLWNDVSLIVFTSGTTGRPKAAMLTYGNALFKTAATVHGNKIQTEDRSLAVAPLCHIAGMVMGLNIPVYTGCECVLLTRFDPITVIKAIETYQICLWYSVAPMNVAILNTPGVTEHNLSSLKRNTATSFGLPVTADLAEKWRCLTKGCLLYEAAYGLSETHTCDTFMPDEKIKYGSCGLPTFDTEVMILDPETREPLGSDEKGEIVIKNPGVFKGYLNRPDATAETLHDGWVYTGDIGSLDTDGYLYFHGRLKEMIKCSGYSVFPEDVESLLNEHPAVLQSAVIGLPDPIRGESVKAFLVLKPEYKGKLSSDEVIDWAKENMAAYKYPRSVEFLDQLPATSSGKVLRRLLKKDLLQ